MNEELAYKLMGLASAILAVIAACGAVGLLIYTAVDFHMAALFAALLCGGASVGAGFAAVHFAERDTGFRKVFANQVEKEVLTRKQRGELRRARGEVVMERALIDVENERQNIVHNQLEAANDPNKPPHKTTFSPDPPEWDRQLPYRDKEDY